VHYEFIPGGGGGGVVNKESYKKVLLCIQETVCLICLQMREPKDWVLLPWRIRCCLSRTHQLWYCGTFPVMHHAVFTLFCKQRTSCHSRDAVEVEVALKIALQVIFGGFQKCFEQYKCWQR
jgi:hypothetical protein